MATEKQTIDLTPTWVAVVRIMITVLKNGSPEGQNMAETELLAIGQKLDDLIANTTKEDAPEPAASETITDSSDNRQYALIWGSFEAGELSYHPAVAIEPASHFTRDEGYTTSELIAIKNLPVGRTYILPNQRVMRLS